VPKKRIRFGVESGKAAQKQAGRQPVSRLSLAIACEPMPVAGNLNIFANFFVLLSIRRQSIWLDFPIFH
jgi:hypothetical protein